MKKHAETKAPEAPLAEPKKIVLTVKDRLVVAFLFPIKSNIVGQVIARDIAKKLDVGDAEAKEIDLKKMPNGNFKWEGKKAKDNEYELTAPEVAFLKEQVARVDAAREVTSDTLEICQKVQGL